MSQFIFKPRIILSLLAVFVLFTACDPLKKVQSTGNTDKGEEQLDEIEGKRVYNPETGQYEVVTDVTGELEEVEWTEAEENAKPPISSEATENSGFGTDTANNPSTNPNPDFETSGESLASYNMVLALPFLADQNSSYDTEVNKKSIFALNFYEGAKMAFDVLSNEGVNLEVHVLDTKADEAPTRNLTYQTPVQEAHLIIGTFRSSTAKVMAEYALGNKIPFVSPFFPHNALVEKNPYFIQLAPSVFTHTDAVMQHIKQRYSDDQIVLIGRESRRDRGIINLYQKAHYKYAGSSSVPPLKQVIITDRTSSLEETTLKEHFVKDKQTIFVVASAQESFVYAILRKIDIEKKNFDEFDEDKQLEDDQLTVFGQPKWKDFTKISYDYYEKLNIHISTDTYLDPNNPNVQSFRQSFFNKYGTMPTEQAFKGFDTVLYFGRLLKNQGTGFLNVLDQLPNNGLHTQYTINRVITKQRPVSDDDLSSFDQHENTNVYILEFENYQFVKAN